MNDFDLEILEIVSVFMRGNISGANEMDVREGRSIVELKISLHTTYWNSYIYDLLHITKISIVINYWINRYNRYIYMNIQRHSFSNQLVLEVE